ncbi:hypothetical protein ABNG03_05810 [Halorubrum sp. RMP-47]|uniref:hypothetical protein n=1 Tax=Halorubrum miltondacostae TaxID=3076378 RepID=UPI0035273F97
MLVIVTLITASLTLTAPVTAQNGIDTSKLEIGEPVGPSEVEVGQKTIITSTASIPSLPADWSAELEFTAYANGTQIGTQAVSLKDGDTVSISVAHSFEQVSSKDVHFEVTGELSRKGALAEQTAAIDRTTSSVLVTVVDGNSSDDEEEQKDTGSDDRTAILASEVATEGAVFVAPESIQSQVDDLREGLPPRVDRVSHAFVLATSNGLHLTLTDTQPKEGYASVEGTELNVENISIDRSGTDNLELNPIRSTNVEYRDPSKASIEAVSQDPGEYRRELLEFTANHRSIALDDEQSEYKATAGVLVDDPLSAQELFGTLGERSSTTLNEVQGDTIGSVLSDRSQPHIVTTAYGTETDYWENMPVTMSGIVATPQSPVGEFIQSQREFNTLAVDSGTPILYVIDQQHDTQRVTIADLSTNTAAYEGDIVRFESNLYMNSISSKRVIESTGTKMPPVDTVLHGGVAWDKQPDSRDDIIGVVAASSITQKQLTAVRTGTYDVLGEVVSANDIKGYRGEGAVLLAYDLEKTNSLDGSSVSDLVKQESTELSKVLERQANPTRDVATATPSSETGNNTGSESTDDATGQDGGEATAETDNETEPESTSSVEETGDTQGGGSETNQDTEPPEETGIMRALSELIKMFADLFS